MWYRFAEMITTGNPAILGMGWVVGPSNKFVEEHQVACTKDAAAVTTASGGSSSSTELPQNNDQWYDLANPAAQLKGNTYLRLWYVAVQNMMVSFYIKNII
jgi:hypothetical protein